MSNLLHVPSLGPIVGHTTANSVRIWARGADVDDMRSVGIAALYKGRRYIKGSARYFRLRREFDRTGVADFDGLEPDTVYNVRLGCIIEAQGEMMDVVKTEDLLKRLPKPEVWRTDLKNLPAESTSAKFRTFEAQGSNGFSFLFGSCRYPGFFWDRKRSDQIFSHMADDCDPEQDDPARFVIMVGDQIYADLLNRHIPIGLADTHKEFHERYVEAFSTPNIRQLLCSVPHYMMLDDHEIEDNWVRGRLKKDHKRKLFLMAIGAFSSYQWFHGPRTYANRFCYQFDYAGYPFFVLDERTQRIRDDKDTNLDDNHLLGRPAKNQTNSPKGQIDLFCDWLVKQQENHGNRPKFVVTPSVFAPNEVSTVNNDKKKQQSDSWPAFPVTRRQILQTIIDNDINNVVFLSGDIHCSNTTEIYFKNKRGRKLGIRCFDITSSAFYWPYAFADGEPLDYVHDSEKEGDGFDVYEDGSVVMHYKAENFQQDDNYSRVNVTSEGITVISTNRKGRQLYESHMKFIPEA